MNPNSRINFKRWVIIRYIHQQRWEMQLSTFGPKCTDTKKAAERVFSK